MTLVAPWRRNRRRLAWWVMVCLLGLSVGSSVAVVVAFHQAVLKPLPGSHPERVVAMGGLAFGGGIGDPIAWWQTDGLEHLSRYTTGDILFESESVPARWIRLTVVSGAFFEVFGQPPLMGRTLTRSDEGENRRVIVLREDLWRRVRARGQRVDEGQVRLNGEAFSIVGVVPQSFSFPSESQAWITHVNAEAMRVDLAEGIGGLPPVRSQMGWVGRLRHDASVAQVQDQLTARLNAANTTLTPKTGVSYGGVVQAISLQDRLSATVKPELTVLLLSTTVILLLAFANCVLYSLTVAADRRGEIALRLGLGASRSAIRAELIAESILMSAICMAASVATAWTMINLSRWLLFAYRVYIPPFAVVLPVVLSLSCAIGIIVSALVSIPSALVARSVSLAGLLGSGIGRMPSRSRLWSRRLFLAGTGAASTLLVAGAFTADVTFTKAIRTPLGHDSSGVVAMRLVYSGDKVADDRFALKRTELMQAVSSAGATGAVASVVPITASTRKFQQVVSRGVNGMAAVTSIDGDFFRVRGIRIIAGRSEDVVRGRSVVVNRSLATHLWGDVGAAVGQSVAVAGPGEDWAVVAVAEDSRTVDQGNVRVFELYRPFGPPSGGVVAVEVLAACRTSCAGESNSIIDAVRHVPGGQLARADTVANLEWNARAGAIVSATVWSVFALLAGVLALAGSATLAAHTIAQRRVEIGVRGALGASPSRLTWMLTTGSLLSLAAGALTGIGLTGQALKIAQSAATSIEAPEFIVVFVAGLVVTTGGTMAAFLVARRTSVASVAVLLRTN